MDYTFTPQEQALRAELRAFLRETLGPSSNDGESYIGTENFEFQRQFNMKLAARGWIAPAWPEQYGGMGASYIEQMIFSEELNYNRAPDSLRVFSVGMIG